MSFRSEAGHGIQATGLLWGVRTATCLSTWPTVNLLTSGLLPLELGFLFPLLWSLGRAFRPWQTLVPDASQGLDVSYRSWMPRLRELRWPPKVTQHNFLIFWPVLL